MSNGREFDKQGTYEIRVKACLEEPWSGWFEGFSVAPQPSGETVLVGPIADQAALHGLLARIRDLGLPLLLVKRLESGEQHDSGGQNATDRVCT